MSLFKVHATAVYVEPPTAAYYAALLSDGRNLVVPCRPPDTSSVIQEPLVVQLPLLAKHFLKVVFLNTVFKQYIF